MVNSLKFIVTLLSCGVAAQSVQAQTSKSYRETPPRINDLVHTKLEVRPDYARCYLYAKAWITLQPHAYSTDSLRLDAKGMAIQSVALAKGDRLIPLGYLYRDGLHLVIKLDKSYRPRERYTVFIRYTAKPNQLAAKGLYFINPDGKATGKPVQLWTQGETETASTWFPTIDQPQQKCTDEIAITVPARYVTLSNGRLATQKHNADGSRTDVWKMELPHSPYLFMMAAGDFKIYHDHWRSKPVDYYLEPQFAPYAKDIFGSTPEMMEFYSRILGVDFPWNKYAQIVVRDYVSGAMENTTATLHGEEIQATRRELIDRYYDRGRATVAHELFHQWFGDYVTCESWSNLALNESFADFGEMLWAEHRYGKDEAGAHSDAAMQSYLASPANYSKDLVRFQYHDQEELFDAVTYAKGGRVLNMLRNYLGDEIFFKGLQVYLRTNAFRSAEAQQLRLALESVSGKDLNWFFNQWFYGAGHPVLDIRYAWNEADQTEQVYISQRQKDGIFQVPLAVDIYSGGRVSRHPVWLRHGNDTLTFHTGSKPDLVNVDADKTLVCQKMDHHSAEEFAFQYAHAPLYLDRLEALNAAIQAGAGAIIRAATQDPYYGLRLLALQNLTPADPQTRPILMVMTQDTNTLVRAAAIAAIGRLKRAEDMNLFTKALASDSYAVQGAALLAFSRQDLTGAYQYAQNFEKDNSGPLTAAIVDIYAQQGSDRDWSFVTAGFKRLAPQEQYNLMPKLAGLIGRSLRPANVLEGIDLIRDFGMRYPNSHLGPTLVPLLDNISRQRAALGDTIGASAGRQAITVLKAMDAHQ